MSEQDHERAAPRPLTPTILFLLLGGVLLLAVGIWTGRGERRPASSTAGDSLVITAPADSDQVPAPLEIAFSTRAPLRLSPMGWQAGQLHLHALVDTAQVMPGTLDIHALGDGQFTWQITGLAPGAHQVQLVWARPDHRTIPEGASQVITVILTGTEEGQGQAQPQGQLQGQPPGRTPGRRPALRKGLFER